MKTRARIILLVVAVALIFLFVRLQKSEVPVVGATHTLYPSVIMDVKDPSLEEYAAAWQAELARRFPNSVGVLCHGGTAEQGRWLCLPWGGPGGCWTIEDLITIEQKKYPGRTIVLLCCNTEHLVVHDHPGVWYSPSSVWCVPDRAFIDSGTPKGYRFTLDGRSSTEPDDVGNAFEMLEAN